MIVYGCQDVVIEECQIYQKCPWKFTSICRMYTTKTASMTLHLSFQHAPSGGATHCHLLCKLEVLLVVESLRECVSNLFSCWHILQFDFLFLDLAI